MENNKLPDSLLNSKCFQTLSSEELQFIEKKHRILKYSEGEYIIKQGSFASQIMFLQKGLVKIFINNQGVENILSLETDNVFLGLPAISSSNAYPYSIMPIEKTSVCLFDIQDIQSLIKKNGTFASELIIQLGDYLQHCFDRMHCLLNKQIHGRLATIMLCLSERIYKTDKFTISLSRKDLAELTAMSVESLSRVIKEFNDDKIVQINGKNVEILDMNKLKHIDKTG